MRKFLLSVVAAAGAMAGAMPTASAQNYPWCLVDDLLTGSTSCYYATREQCQASAGGNIGHCIVNPAYAGPPVTRKPRR